VRARLLAPAAAAGLAAMAAGAAAVAASTAPPATTQCKKIKGCVTVQGPWVAVPAHGEVSFLLECPKRQGVIAGFDALASSPAVRVSWDGKLGTPVRAGTSTESTAFFRAASADGRAGVFQPFLGCIPPPKTGARSTLSARVTKPGAPLDRWKTTVTLKPGKHQKASRGCGKKGERLVGGWQAVVFNTSSTAPDPALADLVHVELTVGDRRVLASIRTDAEMPPAALAQVQVGAVCTK
jgi:hypothetical protein